MADPDINQVTATPEPAAVIEYLKQALSDAQMATAQMYAACRSVSDELVLERAKVRDLTGAAADADL